MSALDVLLDEIFDSRPAALRAEFGGWARESRRFATFAGDYRAKIRAKLRHAGDDDSRRDLRAELETAALLLRDERFSVEYEKYAAAKQRGPDFTVTFKTHTPFNVEVRRLRAVEGKDDEARATRLVYVLCDKVQQMPPSIANLLWLSADGTIVVDDVNAATTALRQLADRKADDFFARRSAVCRVMTWRSTASRWATRPRRARASDPPISPRPTMPTRLWARIVSMSARINRL